MSRSDGHHVEAAVEAVDEIDVGMSRIAPHGFGARGASASEGVTGGVGDPEVGLDLGQPHHNLPIGVFSDQQLAQQLTRHDLGGTLVEVTFERWGV